MVPNSAYKLVPIVAGTNYAPAATTEDFVDPNLGLQSPAGATVAGPMSPPIFALFCTYSSGVGNVVLQALGNDDNVVIPASAFKEGVVYYIYLKKLLSGDVTFVGYQYAQMPLVY